MWKIIICAIFLTPTFANSAEFYDDDELPQLARRGIFDRMLEEYAGKGTLYKLSRERARTSSLVQEGGMVLEAIHKGEDIAVEVQYAVKVLLSGHKKGSKKITLPSHFLSDSFFHKLKTHGEIAFPLYSLKHEGNKDVSFKTVTYKNCHVIRIFNVKHQPKMTQDPDEIVDPQILLYVKKDLPGVGAAMLDLSGTYKGRFVRFGFDIHHDTN